MHPGWKGKLVLEMINLGACPILLTPMMYIAQLIVEEVKGCPRRNDSQFQEQTTAAGTTNRIGSETTIDPVAGDGQS